MTYKDQQRTLIRQLNRRLAAGKFLATSVPPVSAYEDDRRTFLAFIARPPASLAERVLRLQERLLRLDPHQFAIPRPALHFTVKNVRTVSDPPAFTAEEVERAKRAAADVLPGLGSFELQVEGVLLTPSSLALAAYSSERFDAWVRGVDRALRARGVRDDKTYASDAVFFSNLTLLRYVRPPTPALLKACSSIEGIRFEPFEVKEVLLVSANLAFSPGLCRVHAAFETGRG